MDIPLTAVRKGGGKEKGKKLEDGGPESSGEKGSKFP